MRQVREVQVEDVLGREPVRVEIDRVGAYLRGRVVLVTGAGGSIGAELSRQIARVGPKPPGAGRERRERAVRDPPRARGGAPLRARRRGAGRLQGRHAHARGLRRARAVGGLPRRRLQARAADGGEPGRGGAQQRRGHAHRGRGRRRGRRGALRARLHRQGGQPRHGDGRLEGAGRVGRGGRAEPLQGHALRGRALRQRARLLGLGGADLPAPDRAGRPGHGHRRRR